MFRWTRLGFKADLPELRCSHVSIGGPTLLVRAPETPRWSSTQEGNDKIEEEEVSFRQIIGRAVLTRTVCRTINPPRTTQWPRASSPDPYACFRISAPLDHAPITTSITLHRCIPSPTAIHTSAPRLQRHDTYSPLFNVTI
jgi:hypothetical protein